MGQLFIGLLGGFVGSVLLAVPPSRAFTRAASRAGLLVVVAVGCVLALSAHRSALGELRSTHAAQLSDICTAQGWNIAELKTRLQTQQPRLSKDTLMDRWYGLSQANRVLWKACVESPPKCEPYTGLLPSEDDLARIERSFKTGDSCGRDDE
jgi:hypothetical protein